MQGVRVGPKIRPYCLLDLRPVMGQLGHERVEGANPLAKRRVIANKASGVVRQMSNASSQSRMLTSISSRARTLADRGCSVINAISPKMLGEQSTASRRSGGPWR